MVVGLCGWLQGHKDSYEGELNIQRRVVKSPSLLLVFSWTGISMQGHSLISNDLSSQSDLQVDNRFADLCWGQASLLTQNLGSNASLHKEQHEIIFHQKTQQKQTAWVSTEKHSHRICAKPIWCRGRSFQLSVTRLTFQVGDFLLVLLLQLS